MQSLAKDVHTRHLFVFFFSAKYGRTRQAEQCITPGIRLFVTPQRLLEDSSCANNEFLLLPLADVVTIRKDRKKWKLCGLASNRQLFSISLKPVGTRWSIVSHCQIFQSQFLGTGQLPSQQTIIRFEIFRANPSHAFLKYLETSLTEMINCHIFPVAVLRNRTTPPLSFTSICNQWQPGHRSQPPIWLLNSRLTGKQSTNKMSL